MEPNYGVNTATGGPGSGCQLNHPQDDPVDADRAGERNFHAERVTEPVNRRLWSFNLAHRRWCHLGSAWRAQTNRCDIRRELSTCLNSGEWSSVVSSNS